MQVRKAFNLGSPIETEVLHGIDLTLCKGDFCAVMGPSGSGKSTLLNIIGLLDRPTAGQLKMGNAETTALNDSALTHLRGHMIGFVFQYHHLLTAFTALENVMLPMMAAQGFATPGHAHQSARADCQRGFVRMAKQPCRQYEWGATAAYFDCAGVGHEPSIAAGR